MGLSVTALLLIGAIVYLPLAGHFGLYKDDWYSMYDAYVHGPSFFTTIFAIDRPARAPLQFVLYTLFGEHILYYQLTAYLYRLLGALALFWTLRMVWPSQRATNFLISLFYLIYPGFLSQVNAIDFQAHLFSLMLGMTSIALTVKTVLEQRRLVRLFSFLGALLTGLGCLFLMEYFIGLEVFRFALIALLVFREKKGWRERPIALLKNWLPFVLAPAFFLYWHTFLFEGQRRATDLGAQLGQLAASPLNTGLWWLVYLLQDVLNVIVLSWGVPLYNLVFPLRLRDFLLALLVGLLVAGLLFLFWKLCKPGRELAWQKEALLLGLISVFGGILPVTLANRHVDFVDYSRYTLPASAGGVIILVALITLLKSASVRKGLFLVMAITATMVHYANAVSAVQETQATRNFWWQVSWRAPSIAPGTTLAVDYPSIAIEEDYFVWGPADRIYYPQKQIGDQVNVMVPAVVLDQDNLTQIMAGKGQSSMIRRGNDTNVDYGNVLVLTQPAENACVRVLNGTHPELSSNDREEIMLSAPTSRQTDVLLDGSHTPPASIFGSEPSHGWCYYYEKADIARQQGDWQKVVQIEEQALQDGFYPSDPVEWMPLLEAYTRLGQQDKLHHYVSILSADPFMKSQACTLLTDAAPDANMQQYIQLSFCE